MGVLVGMVTFGNLAFTKLAIESIRDTTKKSEPDFFVVVGKPGDTQTAYYLQENKISHVIHHENWGFPKSVNDIYDYAWKENNYDNLILAGNDIVAYPGAVDKMISLAKNSDFSVISATQYDVKSLVKEYPQAKNYFVNSEKLVFFDFTSKPWELAEFEDTNEVADMQMYDIQNLCLYKKVVFDTVGYTDVNYYPAYFVDNDYAQRIVMAKLRTCTMRGARFFHFWSRTIHQGSGGSTNRNFEGNRAYYKHKWGGTVGEETNTPPIKIDSREEEERIITYWRNL